MAQLVSAFASKLIANAAAVATQMGGGTTTAEVTSYGNFLTNLSKFPSEYAGTALRTNDTNIIIG